MPLHDEFPNKFWRLMSLDGTVIAPALVLLADGNIGLSRNPHERRWEVHGGSLTFKCSLGFTTSVFDCAMNGALKPRRFYGRYNWPGGEDIYLEQIKQPALENWPDDPWEGRRVPLLREHPGAPRENLIVLCANERSLHAKWQGNSSDDQRNWDLCITFYGEDPSKAARPFEYLAHQYRLPKWKALFNLFYPESPLWNYQYIWLPDDDLMTNWNDVNRLFALCRRYSLSLAQPSIDPSSNVNHKITQTNSEYSLRFTNFVEIMCPVFGCGVLRAAIGTFRDTTSGYGLDNLWPSLLARSRNRVAIIDAISVAHTRPLGMNYDGAAAVREGRAMQNLYSAHEGLEVYGGIFASSSKDI